MVLLNSGAALLAAGRVDDLSAGIAAAAECIDSGRALRKLQELVELSNSFA
jgi:anthranilate phosphoribosyltransferase